MDSRDTRADIRRGHDQLWSISAISQLLLARFGPNFKQWVQGTYTTDYKCHHNICPGKCERLKEKKIFLF